MTNLKISLSKTSTNVYFAVLPKSLYKDKFDITELFTEPGNKEILFLTEKAHKGRAWNGFRGTMSEILKITGEIDYSQNVLLIARYL